jgi:inhibitor of cysteine peptidase
MSYSHAQKKTRRVFTLAATLSALAVVALCLAAGSRAKSRPSGDARAASALNNTPAALDLKDFGATGDGVTDDGPALQAALDALADAGGGSLYVPEGRYAILTPVAKSFTGLDASVTIYGVTSNTPVPPPDASGQELTHGLDLKSEFRPRVGAGGAMLALGGLRSASVKDIAFVGTAGVVTDAASTLAFVDVDDAAVTHCEFYGLSSSVYGSDVVATRSSLRIERSVFLGCTANSGAYTSVVQNIEWKGFMMEEAVFADYGQRPELFSKTGLGSPISWVEIGNAAAVTNDSPRREAVIRSVFLDEGGYFGITAFPARYTPASAPIDLLYLTGLRMNVSNFNTSGHYLIGPRAVMVEDSVYGWSHHADSAIRLENVGAGVLDRVRTEAEAWRIRADSTTGRLTVIDSVYEELSSLAQQTVVIKTTQPDQDPVLYVREHFESALARAPDAAAHFYWSDKILRCGADAQCVADARSALDAYLAASPSATFEITGRVADENDSPLAGVAVALTGSQSASTTTGADGLYYFSKLPTSGVYTVAVSKRHYTFATPSKTLTTPAGDSRADFAAVLQRYAISGRVTKSDNSALAGASVSLTGSKNATTTTDASGAYSFTSLAAGGAYTVKPTLLGHVFSPASRSFTDLSANTGADFSGLFVEYKIKGRVAKSDGAAVAGVTVSLSGSKSAATTTDASGNYTFNAPSGGDYTVTPSKTDYTFNLASRSFTALGSDQTADFTATPGTHAITGRVTKSGGAALAGALVTLSGSKSATATTDSNGDYSFTQLPSDGNYTVTPSKANYTFTPSSQTFDQPVADKTASFAGALVNYRISGRVTEGASGLAGVTVTLAGAQAATATTDSNGAYSFNARAEGDYTVTPSKAHYTFAPQAQTFNNLSGDKTGDFSATLMRHTVSGRVTKSDNSALAGATVALNGAQTSAATTDAQGNFSFANLKGGGDYTVTPALRHYTFAPASREFRDLGADASAAFVATLDTHTISGRVTKSDGSGLAGATVALTGSKTATTTADANGAYSFTNLDGGGDYTVTASKTNYTFAASTRTFDDLSANQTADFSAALLDYRISGRVTENGSPLAGVAVALTGSLTASATTAADGSYSFTVPAEGGYTVTPSKARYTFAPQTHTFANLGADETADFAAAVMRFAINGRVADINNTALQGVTVTLTGSQSATATTDSNGAYSFPSLAADGAYTLTPTLTDFSFAPKSKTFAGLEADTHADFTGSLVTFRVSGRVTEKGAGVGGVAVDLLGSHPLLGPDSRRVVTVDDGSYSFNVTSGGTYSVTPSKKDYTFAPASASFNIIDGDRAADFDATHKQFVEFSASAASVSEGGGTVEFTVTRGGDTSTEVSSVYEVESGTAARGADVVGSTGRVTFAPGETTKTFQLFITDDSLVEGAESFSVALTPEGEAVAGERSTVAVTIVDNDTDPTAANAIDGAEFFVRQHYRDFFGRDPDDAGLHFWTGLITQCGPNPQCVEGARINVSGAFFLSIEFQETGFFVHKAYKAAFGRAPERLKEFTLDSRGIGAGIVVGETGWQQKLETHKATYVSDFVARRDFESQFPLAMTPAQFISALDSNTGDSLSESERAEAEAEFAGAANTEDLASRARVLRRVIDNGAFHRRETSPAFVLMQYFGYLRRAPDDPPNTNLDGYNFWLKKLNDNGGDFKRAEMVKAFLSSDEYRHRFGN